MKRCWLHIGMHKTGSTSLQASLAAVENPVGWKYLTVGGSRNMGGSLYAMFAREPHKYYWFKTRGDTPERVARYGAKLRKKLAAAIEACSEENIIISGESLSLVDGNGIRNLRNFLRPLCDDIRVIGYVRPPIGFKISFFQQQIKHRNCPFDFSEFKLKYYKRFNKFDDAFGRSNVLLRKFEPAKFPNRCVVSDFCAQLGIEGPAPGAVVRVNESLCREACGMLYAYRKFGPDQGIGKDVIKESKQILAPFFAMRGTKFTVSKSSVMPSLAQDEADLRWMEDRLGESLGEVTSEDGTEVMDEDDLLRIEHASCVEFANRFREIHDIPLPDAMIPTGSPVDPKQVAEFIGYCQVLCRERIAEQRVLKPKRVPKKPVPKKTKSKVRRFFLNCRKWFRKATGATPGI